MTAKTRCPSYQSVKMEGLDIPEDLRAKLMAHLGVSGNKIFSKKIERYEEIHFHKTYDLEFSLHFVLENLG